MKTSKEPAQLIFFKKESCAPCLNAQLALDYVLGINPEFESFVTILKKEEHPDLVKELDLSLYPTVIIADQDDNEISRKVGGRTLTHEWWNAALYALYRRSTDSE